MKFVPNVQEVLVVIELMATCKIATITSDTIHNFGVATLQTRSLDDDILHMLFEELIFNGYHVIGKLKYTEEFTMNSYTGLMTNVVTLIVQKEE